MTISVSYAPEHVSELGQWLEQQASVGSTRVVLRQRSEDGTSDDMVREWSLSDGSVSSPRDLANVIYKRAAIECRHFRNRVLYGAFAYRDKERVDHMFLSLSSAGGTGSEDMTLAIHQRDAASLASVTAQLMRHNEASARLAVGQNLDIVGHYKVLLETATKRIDDLESRYFDMMALHDKLMSMQHSRDLELSRASRAEKNQDFMREQLGVVAPVVLQKLVGGLTGNAGGSPILGEEMLSKFLGSLTNEQQQAILSSLTPQQQISLQQIYISYAKRSVAREKQKAKKKTGGSDATNGAEG